MSLKQSGTDKQLAIMITDNVSTPMRDVLSQVFNHVELVNILDSNDLVNLSLLERPDLGVTFTKLHCWRLVQYSKCVFMDADTLVLQNIDELFEREELSAAPDPGWPDSFNSGVFVFQPKLETYIDLLQFAIEKGSFDGGDQDLLNMFFSDWSIDDINKRLTFVFKCVNQASNSYLPAYTDFRSQIKVLHFLGPVFDSSTGNVKDGSGPNDESQEIWRSMFITHVEPLISKHMVVIPRVKTDISVQKPFKCEFCGSRYPDKRHLTIHKRLHIDFNFTPEIHIKVRPVHQWCCEICDETFASLDHIQRHVNEFHLSKKRKLTGLQKFMKKYSEPKVNLKKVPCLHCKDKFRISHMKNHLESHRIFKCHMCDKKFFKISQLNSHKLYHGSNAHRDVQFVNSAFSVM